MSGINIDERLFGSPISGKVRAELEKRQKREKNENDVYASIADETKGYNLNERTPFVRMWTSLKLIEPGQDAGILEEFPISQYKDAFESARVRARAIKKEDPNKNQEIFVKPVFTRDNKKEKFVIYNPEVREQVDYYSNTYIVGDYNYELNYGQIPALSSALANLMYTPTPGAPVQKTDLNVFPKELQNNETLKPQAGITSVTSETQEYLGVLKSTTVNFVVHNFHDFDRIYNRYFLKPGAKIFVDFGWSDIKDLYDPDDLISSGRIKEFLYNQTETPGYEDDESQTSTSSDKLGVVTEAGGNLEVICGIVTDYTSKVLPNGSVECSVTLMSSNSALLQAPIDENLQELLIEQIQYGVPYLGVLPFLQTYFEESEDLFKTLYLPDTTDPSKFEAFDKIVRDIAEIELNNPDTYTPKGNSVRTGVFCPNALDLSDVYLSWGFIEDILLNEKFGFGKSSEEITFGDNLNLRFDSSNQFTAFSETRLKKQSSTEEFEESPKYLYPEFWGNNCDSAQGDDEGGDYGLGSYSFQKGKYPTKFYPENLSTPQSVHDKKLKRIPIREVFIHIDVMINVLRDIADDRLNIRRFVNNVLETIRDDSGDKFPLFDWQMSSNHLGTEIKIVDNKMIDAIRRIKQSGEVAATGAVEAGQETLQRQNKFFQDIFTFEIMSPSSIVKEYNLEFKMPSGDYANMYAIQGMSYEDKVLPLNDTVGDVMTIDGMDNDSLGILYQPDQGSYRINQMSTDSELGNVKYTARDNIKSLMSSDIYSPAIDVNNLSFRDEISLSETQEGILGSDDLFGSPSETDYRQNLGDFGDASSVIDIHHQFIISAGNRVAYSLASYYSDIEQLELDVSIVDRANLLPFTLSLTTYGISTIQPGDIFKVDYLPEIYKRNSMLQTMKVIHNINSDGWFTTLETLFKPLGDIKTPYLVDVETQLTPYLSPTYLIKNYSHVSGFRVTTDGTFESGGASGGGYRVLARRKEGGSSFYGNVASHKSHGGDWGKDRYYDPAVLFPYFHHIKPVEGVAKAGFQNIKAVYQFEVTELLYEHRFEIQPEAPLMDGGRLGKIDDAIEIYQPLLQREHRYEDPQQNYANTRDDCAADEYGYFYTPKPVILSHKYYGGYEGAPVYYLIIYGSGADDLSFIMSADDITLGPNQPVRTTAAALESLKFWDTHLLLDGEQFTGASEPKIPFNQLGPQEQELYHPYEIPETGESVDVQTELDANGLVWHYRAITRNYKDRKLRRDEVEEVYNKYMSEGDEWNAKKYAEDHGFGDIYEHQSKNPNNYKGSGARGDTGKAK